MQLLPELPNYTLATKAYDGSETILYRGHRDADGVPVAVKVIKNEYPTGRDLARLRREFAILKELSDLPGVVHVYALEKCGRRSALVMEDVGTSSLHDLIKARRLDLEAALKIAISLADTLDSLHRREVIHKDIKPRNIMIDEATLAPRLVDFGIAARLSREAANATSPALLEGTLAYLSPEQTGRMNRTVDLRTDLYSFGASLFELLTGAPPFAVTDPTELIYSHIARSPTPPHEQVTEVPRALSEVVMKLLAKMPEERYQSARGVKADLERCLSEWTASRRIELFAVGQKDRTDELRIPQKLYGREEEVLALLSAFERARGGKTELMLISGYSGAGKSVLVNELHKPITRQNGTFAGGKFDPNSRDVPLAPIAHAFRGLVRQILTESATVLDTWRVALLNAVGPNGRLLFDLIPELELVIGPQPEVPALGPTETRNRFDLVVQRFLRVFATAEHPLALFLDDLQWADPASLRLLGLLLTDPESKHQLILGAYRDNEVDASHPLVSALDELRKAGVTLTELTLRPLDLPTVTVLLADTLGKPQREVEPLSTLMFDKTQGNPFFLSQLLGTFHEQRLVWFDASSEAFTWDLARIEQARVTDNVVELMLGKLRRLAPRTQSVLSLAACIGHAFDLAMLATIHRKSPADTAADLWEALHEGLVVPIDGDYRLLDVGAGAAPEISTVDWQISYRFLHDRVHEAAYALIREEQKQEVHLSIGRLLWDRSGRPPRDEDVLEITRHLRLSAHAMANETERCSAAELHLRGGRKVKAATAYKAAADHFAAGIDLLGPEGWARDYALCFSLHIEGAECAYLSGALERAESLFDVILPRAASSLERVRVHDLRMILCTTLARYGDAMKAGRDALSCLGVTLPATQTEQQAAFGSGPAEIAEALGDRRIEDLLDAPVSDDAERDMTLQLLSDILLPTYFVAPLLNPTIIFKHVQISLKHGHSNLSALGYAGYGHILATVLGRPVEGYAFSKLGSALHEKLPNARLDARLPMIIAGHRYYCEPVRESVRYCASGQRAAIEHGDFVYLSTSAFYMSMLKIGAGYPIEELRDDYDRLLALMERTRDATATAVLTVAKQAIANLQGRTRSPTSLSDEHFDEDGFVEKLDVTKPGLVLFYYYVLKLEVLLLHAEPQAAIAVAEKAEQAIAKAAETYSMTRVHFYACLLLLSLPTAETVEEQQRREAAITRHRAKIADLAALCPQNFQHQRALIDAEAAYRAGKHAEAMDLYDEAITLAKENEFPQDEALANERCAKMYMAIGRTRAARGYLDDAYLGYLHWGALVKAEQIERDYGHLLPSRRSGGRRSSLATTAKTTATTILGKAVTGNLREAALIVRAAQVIAGETALPKVIERISKIVLESAGAEQGALIRERNGRLFVDATFGEDSRALDMESSAPLAGHPNIAQSVVLFVSRTREPMAIDDACVDSRFAADPHVAAERVKSILCLPLFYQDRLTGLLYLENKKASAAFTEARVELLELVSAQAAIAIENAQMVSDVRAANLAVQRANTRLEAEVAQRTEELRVSNRELGAANQRLEMELVQREHAEREGAELKERVIEAQRARLSEMSTPLIPITDRIMVMPLIGTVDAERAAQVLEVALEGAQRHQARVVILDITGIKQIDTYVVRTLLHCTSALRLLGTQAMITGIRAEVAQTMVALGTDLAAIITKATLQSGIAYALKLSAD